MTDLNALAIEVREVEEICDIERLIYFKEGVAHDISELLERVADALTAATPPSEERQIGWLIERDGKWWGPEVSHWEWEQRLVTPELWTADANKALRFHRKEDAEAFRRWEGLEGGAMSTEHIWIGGLLLSKMCCDCPPLECTTEGRCFDCPRLATTPPPASAGPVTDEVRKLIVELREASYQFRGISYWVNDAKGISRRKDLDGVLGKAANTLERVATPSAKASAPEREGER